MFGKKTAEKLDTAAGALHKAGRKVAGERGGRTGDAIATAALGGLRARCNTDCTCNKCR
ncbi:hypothetical protein ACWDBF_21375 [Streptomyces angustmyceticus]